MSDDDDQGGRVPESDIGAFIRQQRELAELSMRRLADMAGVSNPYLSQIERGLKKPSAGILQQLAKALELSAETMYVQAGMLDGETAPPRPGVEATIRRAAELTEDQRTAMLAVYNSYLEANAATGAAPPPGSAAPLAEEPDVGDASEPRGGADHGDEDSGDEGSVR